EVEVWARTPVCSWVATTVAPGTAAGAGSFTNPVIVPVVSWATANWLIKLNKINRIQELLKFIRLPLPQLSFKLPPHRDTANIRCPSGLDLPVSTGSINPSV